MEKPKDLLILEGISCLSFNKDFSMCVLSKRDKNLYIYKLKKDFSHDSWELVHTLSNHLQYVYSVDWHPITNRIISGGHDRNIYIWTYNENKSIWEPGLVNFKTKISVSEVKWSNQGDKFLACSSKLLATGYYEKESEWWTCKSMKQHLSYVSCARFDNSGLFILSGSTDKKGYISSSYVESIDAVKQFDNLPFPKSNYGEILMTIRLSAWATSVGWSPSNLYGFIATQDSIMTVIDTSSQKIASVYLYHSPICHLVPITDTSLFVIGFDRHIYEYSEDEKSEDNWVWTCKRNITGGIYPVKKTPNTDNKSKPIIEQRSGSILDVMKKFEAGTQKKQSLIITSINNQNIHSAQINSANVNNDSLVTTDNAGFLKIWKY